MTDTNDDGVDPLQRGVDAAVATRTAKEIYDAIDVDALLGDQPRRDAVDIDLLADAIGRAVGRAFARKVVEGEGASGLTKRVVGSKVTHKVAAETFRIAVENVDTGAVAERLVRRDGETIPAESIQEGIDARVDGDASTIDSAERPETTDVPDAGGDTESVHDAAGADHTGVLDGTDRSGGTAGDGSTETDDRNDPSDD